jgi:hypothetical protein
MDATTWHPVLAHLGHWYVGGPVFLSPVIVIVILIKISEWREKRRAERGRGDDADG